MEAEIAEKIAEKIASVAKEFAANPRKKNTEKDIVLSAIKKQKSKFKKALTNGYTRKDILAKLHEDGIKITAREFAKIMGIKKKSTASENI